MNEYQITDLRKYDRDILKFGNSPEARVIEKLPNCWFCSSGESGKSSEHIFSLTIQKYFGETQKVFEPVTYFAKHGYAAGFAKPKFPGKRLVNRRVCRGCNNGWMSRLEARFEKIFMGDPADSFTESESETIAHWFTKTAVLLNVSQTTRLVWTAGDRMRVIQGPIRQSSVHLVRTETEDLNWIQSQIPMGSAGAECDLPLIARHMSLTHFIAIQVGRYCGLVTLQPWQFSSSKIEVDAGLIWDGMPHAIQVAAIPKVDSLAQVPEPLLVIKESAFFALGKESDTNRCENGS